MDIFSDIKEFSAWVLGLLSLAIVLYFVFRPKNKLKS